MNVDQLIVDKEQVKMSEECVYLCGQSLGLMPIRVIEYMGSLLNDWATL
jgi:kynureninase